MIAVLLIVVGEALSILSEMIAAKSYNNSRLTGIYTSSVLTFAVSGLALIAGYMIGYKAFANIWIITVISITSLLLIEVALGFILFSERPTLGAMLGFACGAVGFLLALTIK